jgi:hypothetical protein
MKSGMSFAVRAWWWVVVLSVVMAVALAARSTAGSEVPAAPVNLWAMGMSSHSVALHWDATNGDETAFEIERRVGDGPFVRIATVAGLITSFDDDGLPANPDLVYTYRVRARRGESASPYCNEAEGGTQLGKFARLRVNPLVVTGGQPCTGTVYLDGPAGAGGVVIGLGSNNPGYASVPPMVTVPAGATSVAFPITTPRGRNGASVDIDAWDMSGAGNDMVVLTVEPSDGSWIAPYPERPINWSRTQIQVGWRGPDKGETATEIERRVGSEPFRRIATSDPSGTFMDGDLIPGTLYTYRFRSLLPGGPTQYSNEVSTRTPLPVLDGITLEPVQAAGGDSAMGTVTLDLPAPAEGVIVWLRSNNPAVGDVPVGVRVSGLTTTASFPISTRSVATKTYVTVSANYDGKEQRGILTVWPAAAPAAPTGLQVSAASPTALQLRWKDNSGTESGFEIERKADGGSFGKIATVPADTTQFLDAGQPGDPQRVVTYRVRAINVAGASPYSNEASGSTAAAVLVGIKLDPAALEGGGGSTGSVTLDGPAPPGGALVLLASGNMGVMTVPATVVVPAGAIQATLVVTTRPVSTTTIVILTATYRGHTERAELTVLPAPLPPQPLVAPADLTAGATSKTQIALAWTDLTTSETGFEIERRTGQSSFLLIATVGANVTSYSDTGLFGGTAYTYRVRAIGAAGPSAYSNNATASTLPVTLISLALSPTQVRGGGSVTATVTLDGPAPAVGAFVTIINPNPDALTAPETVTIPPGALSTTFTITPQAVSAATVVRLEARYGIRFGTEGPTATLTVLPPDPPAAPTILVVSDATTTELALTWLDNSASETGFEIERKRGTGAWAPIHTTAANATSFRDSGLEGSTHYTYRVRAVNLGGGSTWSNEAGGTTSGGTPGVGISFSALTLPKSLTFGDQAVGTPSGARTITLTNTGTAPLTISSVTLKGQQVAEFLLVSDSGEATLAPGAKRTFTLCFTPADVGSRGATLAVVDNAPGSPHGVELGGVGVAVTARGIAVFRPSTCEWFFRNPDGSGASLQFGGPEDLPVAADYLGLGQPQVAVFRPSTHEWFIRTPEGGAVVVPFGAKGDVPVPGDYFGLGRASLAVFRAATREWLLRRDDGSAVAVAFGIAGEVPVPGDYLGLQRQQIAMFQPGTAEWSVRRDDGTSLRFQWGTVGDVPVVGDYLGLGHAQVAVYRPSTGEWFVRQDNGQAITVQFGGPGDVPTPGDYFGLGRLSLGVYRPGEGTWYLRTDLGGTVVVPWGGAEDWPLAGGRLPWFGAP